MSQPNTDPTYETKLALLHLAVVVLTLLVSVAALYAIPALHEYRPWVPPDRPPIVRLFDSWGEIPAFAGAGGSYLSTTELRPSRLEDTVGAAVAANVTVQVPEVPVDPNATIQIDESEYAGIEVRIEDPSGKGMAPFFEALARTARREEGAITRIGHYGDSSIATDLITHTIRRHLQARFGDAGHGFVLAAKGYLPYRHRDVRHYSNDLWSIREVVRRDDKLGRYGYGGVVSVGQGGARATVQTDDESAVGGRVGRFDIYYRAHPRGPVFTVKVDDEEPVEFDTREEERRDAVYSVHVPDGPHKLALRQRPGGTGILYGFVLERDVPGIVYDSLGLVGARALRLTNFDAEHIESQIKRRGLDLLVLAFGGNEASDNKSEEAFYEDYVSVIDRMRAGREDLGCLIVSPLDQARRERGKIVTLPTIPRIIAAQKKAAFDRNCAFFNVYEAMGGEDAMRRWYEARPRLAMGDFRHATPAGYEVIGNLFYKALLAGFSDYLPPSPADRADDAASAPGPDALP